MQRASIFCVLALAGLAVASVTGCGQEASSELLVVYSGDCQGYLDPCG